MVLAVYGDDCVVLQSYPPHLHLLLKPRTADVPPNRSLSLSTIFISVWLPRKRWKVKPKPRKGKRKTFETESNDHTSCFTQKSCANSSICNHLSHFSLIKILMCFKVIPYDTITPLKKKSAFKGGLLADHVYRRAMDNGGTG